MVPTDFHSRSFVMFGFDWDGFLAILSGARGALSWGLIGLFVWWLMFLAPLGRRRFESRAVIAAPAEKIWDSFVLGPEPDDGWTGLSEVQARELLDGAPMRIREVTRLLAGPKKFKTYVYRVTTFDAPRIFETCTQSRDGVDVDSKNATRATLLLTPQAQTTKAILSYEHPVKGLYNLLFLRRIYARMLERLRALCEDRPMPSAARGLGWRNGVLFGVLGLLATAYAMSDGDLAGGWPILLAAALLIQGVVVVHEFGHWLAMRWFGHKGATITMIPFFGGAAIGGQAASSSFEKAIIALMGPGFSALLTLLLLIPAWRWSLGVEALTRHAPGETLDFVTMGKMVVGALSMAFVLIAAPLNLLNLAPLGMMDGARVVDALAESRPLRLLARLALAAGLGFCVYGLGGAADIGPTFGVLAAISLSGVLTPKAALAPALTPMTSRQRCIAVSALALTLGVHGSALHLALSGIFNRVLH
jgi:Zn-dependent protease